MTDEIRVTVVATGLESVAVSAAKPQIVKPNLQAVKASNQEAAAIEAVEQKVVEPIAVNAEKQPEILTPEPEVVRPKMVVNGATAGSVESSNYLDIPAFLRRQAD